MSVVRELDGFEHACLVEIAGEYFVVSSIAHGPETGEPETLAFPADVSGEITSWGDVAGGRHKSRDETIAELVANGPDPESSGRGLFGDTKRVDDREGGEILEGVVSVMETVAKSVRAGA